MRALLRPAVAQHLNPKPMFENLTQRLTGTVERLRGKARLSDENIRETIREVRIALLEADVALPVVQAFIERIKVKAVGQQVIKSLKPGQMLIKVVQDELTAVLGGQAQDLNLRAQPPVIILLAGLQGAGKTTTAGKLAKFLKEREKKRVMLASVDVYRPAAIEQLKILAGQAGADFFETTLSAPEQIAIAAVDAAKRQLCDVLIVDTAGRLAIDEAMMTEVKNVNALLNPTEVLFVVDAMTGQDAANTAKAFNAALPLTGVILTKTDGDARGGAALSIRHLTGKPVKFIGIGEKLDGLDRFYPDRLASRILDMGDVMSLVEDVQRKVDTEKAEKLATKMVSGKKFDLGDFRDQLEQMNNMGGMRSMMDKLPGMGQIPDQVKAQVDDKQTSRMIAMVNSMTPKERKFPDILNGSRKRRIAAGSGVQVQDLNRLLKQFEQMQKMMSKFQKGGFKSVMKQFAGKMGMGGMGGGMPMR
jgi:signal recognition particle subunit SRP54